MFFIALEYRMDYDPREIAMLRQFIVEEEMKEAAMKPRKQRKSRKKEMEGGFLGSLAGLAARAATAASRAIPSATRVVAPAASRSSAIVPYSAARASASASRFTPAAARATIPTATTASRFGSLGSRLGLLGNVAGIALPIGLSIHQAVDYEKQKTLTAAQQAAFEAEQGRVNATALAEQQRQINAEVSYLQEQQRLARGEASALEEARLREARAFEDAQRQAAAEMVRQQQLEQQYQAQAETQYQDLLRQQQQQIEAQVRAQIAAFARASAAPAPAAPLPTRPPTTLPTPSRPPNAPASFAPAPPPTRQLTARERLRGMGMVGYGMVGAGNAWTDALKEWNAAQDFAGELYAIPRKGSEQMAEVREVLAANKKGPQKKKSDLDQKKKTDIVPETEDYLVLTQKEFINYLITNTTIDSEIRYKSFWENHQKDPEGPYRFPKHPDLYYNNPTFFQDLQKERKEREAKRGLPEVKSDASKAIKEYTDFLQEQIRNSSGKTMKGLSGDMTKAEIAELEEMEKELKEAGRALGKSPSQPEIKAFNAKQQRNLKAFKSKVSKRITDDYIKKDKLKKASDAAKGIVEKAPEIRETMFSSEDTMDLMNRLSGFTRKGPSVPAAKLDEMKRNASKAVDFIDEKDWRASFGYIDEREKPVGSRSMNQVTQLDPNISAQRGFSWLDDKYGSIYRTAVKKLRDVAEGRAKPINELTQKEYKEYTRLPFDDVKQMNQFFTDVLYADSVLYAMLQFNANKKKAPSTQSAFRDFKDWNKKN
jgi:hypothetical protein